MRRLPVHSGAPPEVRATPVGELSSSNGRQRRPRGFVPVQATLERLSLELTRACTKGCSFCYNGSSPKGETTWKMEDVLSLTLDCVAHGLKSVSFGGGEPLQYPGVFDLLERLRGRCFRSLTTNGLLLERRLDALVGAHPDKVHVSIHFPGDDTEVARVIEAVLELRRRGVQSGINLLVRRSELSTVSSVWKRVLDAGIGPERVLLLPMRGSDTPTAQQVAAVAGTRAFQSVTCLAVCAASYRFASIGWDQRVGWCSYTASRRPLPELSHQGILQALRGLPLAGCSDLLEDLP